jgi:hypothetical protein
VIRPSQRESILGRRNLRLQEQTGSRLRQRPALHRALTRDDPQAAEPADASANGKRAPTQRKVSQQNLVSRVRCGRLSFASSHLPGLALRNHEIVGGGSVVGCKRSRSEVLGDDRISIVTVLAVQNMSPCLRGPDVYGFRGEELAAVRRRRSPWSGRATPCPPKAQFCS